MIVIIVVGEDEVDDINDVNVLRFRSIVFDFIISKIFKTIIIIGSGDSDLFGFNKEIGMEIIKSVKLTGGHKVNIPINGGQFFLIHKYKSQTFQIKI